MIAVSLNSRIINPGPTNAFWAGFDLHCQGAQLEEMPTAEHRNGWWHANKCQGDTLDYEDSIADRAFWAHGSW